MCGIVGYIGKSDAVRIVVDGLRHLEYRGYDSAGIAVLKGNRLQVRRCDRKVSDLIKKLGDNPVSGTVGIGHTRWATHGRPSEKNAHPHADCRKELVAVHNGIIENYMVLKKELQKEGHTFRSETDTEVIVHLIEKYMRSGGFEKAVMKALRRIKGSYALCLMSKVYPDKIIAARCGSPLIVGIGDGERFVASDVPAIIRETREVIYLGDREIAVLGRGSDRFISLGGKKLRKSPVHITWDVADAEKGEYPHFMLKEIHEQSRVVEETMRGRVAADMGAVHLKELGMSKRDIKSIRRITVAACGTSWHAALIGKYLLEEHTRIPVEVDYAAEFRYRNPVVDKNTLLIVISQSGETADTIAAAEEARDKGARVISICNVVGSSITRLSDGIVYTRAGPEIGVASTKAFTTQLSVLYMMSLFIADKLGELPEGEMKKKLTELCRIPRKIERLLKQEEKVKEIADRFYASTNFLYLGRGEGFPVALEGALKLKEISYIHAEGYPAAEMKHGPIALIDKNMPVVVLALRGRRYEKIVGNVKEIKARDGVIIALASEGDKVISGIVDETIYIPRTTAELSPVLAVIPLQLLAYYIAANRGCPIDQPRNLAKSVTVE